MRTPLMDLMFNFSTRQYLGLIARITIIRDRPICLMAGYNFVPSMDRRANDYIGWFFEHTRKHTRVCPVLLFLLKLCVRPNSEFRNFQEVLFSKTWVFHDVRGVSCGCTDFGFVKYDNLHVFNLQIVKQMIFFFWKKLTFRNRNPNKNRSSYFT